MRPTEFLYWFDCPKEDRAPWWQVAWRLLWVPLIFGGMAMTWLGRLLAFGYQDARYFWRNNP